MNRFFGVVLFFATAGVMSGVLAQPPLISVVKKGADKNTVSLAGVQAPGPYGQIFVKTLARDGSRSRRRARWS
jgi:hypothetical protein